ncbi:uncharacterized protein LOC113147601, partial [Cyclospora cayetanensis]|uniref:Mediator of RNA polymerase II transcription subunit 7 n=1 Tax=Cyclospora cayetanensis TaxID=88456 RepID=A0A6P6S562_9EIME
MEGSTTADRFVSGFPPPPYYWVDCMHSACMRKQEDSSQQELPAHGRTPPPPACCSQLPARWLHGSEAQHNQPQEEESMLQHHQGEFCRPPPHLPDDYWSAFGVCYSLSPSEVTLEADSCLYTPGAPPKSEFRRLFPLYVEACMHYLNELAIGTEGYSNALRKVTRLHRNLLYLLLLLRNQQAQQQVVQRLQQQLQKRRQAADALKRALALSLQDMQHALHLASSAEETAASFHSPAAAAAAVVAAVALHVATVGVVSASA